MKKYLLFLILLPLFTQCVLAQSVKIVPKKIVYHRKISAGFENKKEVFVTYPNIISSDKNLKDKISQKISYWKNFETSLKEIKEDFYVNELTYKINYNKNSILNITLIQDGSGAYPWTEQRFLVIDLKSGKLIKVTEIFESNSVKKVEKLIQTAMKLELKKANLPMDMAFFNKQPMTLKTVKLSDLEGFSVTDKGLIFLFDYDFNFASLAEEPSGRYFFSWKSLKPYLKKDSLLTNFIK